jgi:hypothetical protein
LDRLVQIKYHSSCTDAKWCLHHPHDLSISLQPNPLATRILSNHLNQHLHNECT